ncbi:MULTISPECIES: copper chaperone PCu(A)C [unclassified Streptomyces]|uniref:copper chaperone PCu(A)C n=1 Tax=unclassified Streptomyces TaxID=2593676 RepID=UPI0033FF2470
MNRRTTLAAVIALTAGLALAGCSSDSSDAEPDLKIGQAFMPEPLNADMAGGFLVVKNEGKAADKLTKVTSPLADDVTIHETKNQKMREVKSFDVPAGGELDLERGGSHIMFMGLKKKPKQGEKVSIELHFEKAGRVEVDLPVKETTYNPKHH